MDLQNYILILGKNVLVDLYQLKETIPSVSHFEIILLKKCQTENIFLVNRIIQVCFRENGTVIIT